MFDGIALSKYGGVLAALVLAGFGMPMPEEIPIVTAGAMVGHDAQELKYYDDVAGAVGGGAVAAVVPPPAGVVRWWIMLPLCIAGVVFSDLSLFLGGRYFGTRLLASGWIRRHVLPPEKQQKIEANFAKNGILILLGARLTPGIRSPVFIMAGVLRMPVSRFLLADSLYAIPGINILFWLAYGFTDQFVEAIQAVDRHRPMAIAVVLAAISGVVIYKVLSSWNLSTGDPADIPTIVKPVGKVTHAVEQTIEKAVEKTVDAAKVVVDKVTHPLGHAKPPPPVAAEKPPDEKPSPPVPG